MIKSGGTISQIIEDTFERNIKENVLIQDKTKAWRRNFNLHPRYRYRIEKFQKVFGEKQVQIRDFTPATLPNNSVIEDFFLRAFWA